MPDDVSTPLDDTEMRFKLVAEELFGPSPVKREIAGETPAASTAASNGEEPPRPVATSRLQIDLDADPFVPEGSSVEAHAKGGMLDFDPTKIALYLSEEQKGGKQIGGNKLHKEMEGQRVYNANLLDFLYKKENQHLIPKSWKGYKVFFWGTIYRYPDGYLAVRYLYWDDGGWLLSSYWLGRDWCSVNPAAVPAS